MKKKKIILISVISIVLIAIAAFFILPGGPKNNFSLQTKEVKEGALSTTITATGTIEPIIEVEVGTQVSGKISKIYVDYNSVVKKGDILAEIDKTNLQIEYNTQFLNVQSSKVEYEYQKKNFKRTQELHEKNLVSDTDYETAKYAYEKAESTYKQNASSLEKTKTNLDYATIYSPIDGVVLSREVEEGQTVAASFSTPTMFVIAKDLTKMQVVANVDEADIGNVRKDQRVSFMVDAYPTDVFEGTITQVRLNPTTASNVVTYEVIVNAPNPHLKLKPGLTANITVFTLEKNNILVLPNKALTFKPSTEMLADKRFKINENANLKLANNESAVWIQKGRAIDKIAVVLGETDGINTEIVSGLKTKAIVVLEMKELTEKEIQTAGTETSPFMPKRPGSEKKQTPPQD